VRLIIQANSDVIFSPVCKYVVVYKEINIYERCIANICILIFMLYKYVGNRCGGLCAGSECFGNRTCTKTGANP
jgi:hypothetical protein